MPAQAKQILKTASVNLQKNRSIKIGIPITENGVETTVDETANA